MFILDHSYIRHKCISVDINLENYIQGKVSSTFHDIKSRKIEDGDREPAVEILML